MKIGRITLTVASIAIVVGGPADLRAQELTLPPAPSSATEDGGRAFRAETGPCFYNPYSWMARARLDQSLLAAELQDLARSWGADPILAGCTGHYALTPADFLGSWSYMALDGVPVPERVSQERVKAVWEASLEAMAEGPRAPKGTPADLTPPDESGLRTAREGHVPVPRLGRGYGSATLESRSMEFRVAPGPAPSTYDGVPIVERGRSWERVPTADGRRVWRTEPVADAWARRLGSAYRSGSTTRRSFSSLDRAVRWQEGLGSPSRGASAAMRTFGETSARTPSPRETSSTGAGQVRSPRAGKADKQ